MRYITAVMNYEKYKWVNSTITRLIKELAFKLLVRLNFKATLVGSTNALTEVASAEIGGKLGSHTCINMFLVII